MKSNTTNKHLKQLAESLNASWQMQPGMSDESTEENDYMGILKESLIEFDKATTHKGPVEDLLSFTGEGELNTHKGTKGLVDILERAYHREDEMDFVMEDSDEAGIPVGDGAGKDKDSGTHHDPDEKDLGDLATRTADGQSAAGKGRPTTGVDKPNAGSGGTGILPNPSAPDAQKNNIMGQDDSTSASQETAMKFEAADLLQEEEAKAEKLPPVKTGENEPVGSDAKSTETLSAPQGETDFEDQGEEKRGKMVESVFEGIDEMCEELDDVNVGEEETPAEEEPTASDELGEEMPSDSELMDDEEISGPGDEEEPVDGLGEEEVAAEAPAEEVAAEEEPVDGLGEEEVAAEVPAEDEDSLDALECLETIDEATDEKESEEKASEESSEESPSDKKEDKKENKAPVKENKVPVKENKAGKKDGQKKSNEKSLTASVESLLEEEEEPAEEADLNKSEDQQVLPKPESPIGSTDAVGQEGQVGNVTPDSFNQGGASEGQEAATGEDLDLSSEPEAAMTNPEEEKEPTPGEEDVLEIPAAGEESEPSIENITEESDLEDNVPNRPGDPVGQPGSSVTEEVEADSTPESSGAAKITNDNGTIKPEPVSSETKFEQAIKARKQVEESIVERLIREMEGFSNEDDTLNESIEETEDTENQEE